MTLFVLAEPSHERLLRPLLQRLPALAGAPVRVETVPGLRDRRGAVHAGAFLRERRIALNCSRAEFPRVFVHELFHFVWVRSGNPARLSWERLLEYEVLEQAPGELGWSSEWRKRALGAGDWQLRSRPWRDYCCESFCDTAAWLYSSLSRHVEFTLPSRFRIPRREWFIQTIDTRRLSI